MSRGTQLAFFAALAAVSAAPLAAQQLDLQDRLRVNGYSNFEWEYMPTKAGRGDANGSFDAQEFDIVVNIIPSHRVRVSADMRWEHGVATEDSRGNAAIVQGFAEYTVADALKLRGGKMNVPFGLYNEIYTAKPAIFMYKEPFAVYKADKLGAVRRFQPRSGSGLEALGTVALGGVESDYTVLVANGETSGKKDPFEEDDNRNKSVAGRIRVRPIPSLQLGGSYFNDQYTEYDATGKDTGRRTRQSSYAASLDWQPWILTAQAEWVTGDVRPATTPKVTMQGWFTVLSASLADRYRPYVLYQRLDPNTRLGNDEAVLWGPGVNVRLDGGMFLKFQMDKYHSLPANTRLKGVDYTELAAAVAVAF